MHKKALDHVRMNNHLIYETTPDQTRFSASTLHNVHKCNVDVVCIQITFRLFLNSKFDWMRVGLDNRLKVVKCKCRTCSNWDESPIPTLTLIWTKTRKMIFNLNWKQILRRFSASQVKYWMKSLTQQMKYSNAKALSVNTSKKYLSILQLITTECARRGGTASYLKTAQVKLLNAFTHLSLSSL